MYHYDRLFSELQKARTEKRYNAKRRIVGSEKGPEGESRWRAPWPKWKPSGSRWNISSLCYVSFLQVKHPKRKLFRSNDPLLSVFMWGINHTVKVVVGLPFSCIYLFLSLSGAAACEHPSDAHARRLPGLLQGEDWQPCLQQGEPAQPLQDQGVLPTCLQKPEGAVWPGWHGVSQLPDQVTQGTLFIWCLPCWTDLTGHF